MKPAFPATGVDPHTHTPPCTHHQTIHGVPSDNSGAAKLGARRNKMGEPHARDQGEAHAKRTRICAARLEGEGEGEVERTCLLCI